MPHKPDGQQNEIDRTHRGARAERQTDVLLRFARTMLKKTGVIEDADIAVIFPEAPALSACVPAA